MECIRTYYGTQAYASAKQRSAGTETRKETREVGTQTDSSDDSNWRPPGMRASPASSRTSGFRDAVRPGATRGRREKEGASMSYERRDAKRGATVLHVARGSDKAPYEIRRREVLRGKFEGVPREPGRGSGGQPDGRLWDFVRSTNAAACRRAALVAHTVRRYKYMGGV